MRSICEITRFFSMNVRQRLEQISFAVSQIYEIRLRVNRPVILNVENQEWFLSVRGGVTRDVDEAYVTAARELRETVEYMSNFSLYAFEDELRQGFLTLQGGHRAGMCGKVFLEGGGIKTMKYPSFINLRICHEVKGCADGVMGYVTEGERLFHTLIISPPGRGKTTLLRDVIRQVSDGFSGFRGRSVGVVDERSELGGCYLGIPENDLGMRSDVLDCCPKTSGIELLLRSMSPEVIAVDELGALDVDAVCRALYCGCVILATVHGASLTDVTQGPAWRELMGRGVFERFVVLEGDGGAGASMAIYDGNQRLLWREGHG